MGQINRKGIVAITAAVTALSNGLFVAKADVSYTGVSYTQTFDTLYNPVATGLNDTYNVTNGLPQEWLDNTVSNPGTSDGIDGWYAVEPGPPPLVQGDLTDKTAFQYYVSDGAPKSTKGTLSGGIYDFGYSNAANGNVSDRALGLAGTGASGLTEVGVKLINNTSTTFTQLSIQYTGEEWFTGNSGLTSPKSLVFDYGITSAGNSTLATATNGDPALNFIAPVVNSGGNSGIALDGNAAGNSTTLSSTEQGPAVNWAPGQTLWLTWTISSSVAGGEGLAIDNLTFSAGQTPAHNLTWNPGSTTWSTSTSTTNWLNIAGNSSTYYTDGDFVVFGDTGVGDVTLSGNVTPGSLTFSNTSGTYSLSGGGSIVGNTALIKTGAGTLVLNNINTYAGGTSVDTGTLVINNDNNLGVSSGNVTLTNAATLRTAASITSNRTIIAVSGTNTLDTAGNDSSIAGLNSTGGSLNVIGGGNLTVASINFNASTDTLGLGGSNLILTATSGTQAFAATGSYTGNIVLQGTTRLSFQGGTVGGGGNIVVNAAGAVVNAAGTNLTTDIQNNIVINAANAHIGASTTNTLQVDGVISGNADVYYTNDPANGGKGIVLLDSHNTYTGQSVINLGDAGVVRLGISNALPTGTALSFGDGVNTSNLGAFDLNGFDQTVASLATNFASGNSSQICYGIVDTGFNNAPNTLTIIGSANTTYAGTIGNPPAFPAGTNSQIGGIHDANITLELGAGNTGCLTLSGNNSYTGGTVLNGGTLSVSNDSNLGDPSGAVAFGGGTLEVTGSGFTSTRTIVVGMGGGTVSVDNGAGTLNVGGVVTVAGTLAKTGAGTLTVGGLSVTGGVNLIKGQIVVEDTSGNRTNDLAALKGMVNNAGNSTTGIYSSTAAAAGEVVVVSDNAVRLATFGASASNFGGGTNNVDANSILIASVVPGDANMDGVVDLKDLQVLATHWQQPATDWSETDFDGNGIVALPDLQALAIHWQNGVGSGGGSGESFGDALGMLTSLSSASAVPEPASLALLGLGGAVLALRRKK